MATPVCCHPLLERVGDLMQRRVFRQFEDLGGETLESDCVSRAPRTRRPRHAALDTPPWGKSSARLTTEHHPAALEAGWFRCLAVRAG